MHLSPTFFLSNYPYTWGSFYAMTVVSNGADNMEVIPSWADNFTPENSGHLCIAELFENSIFYLFSLFQLLFHTSFKNGSSNFPLHQ